MLLRHELCNERTMFEHGTRAEKRRTFRHLKVTPLKRKDGAAEQGGRDLLVRALPWPGALGTAEPRTPAAYSPSHPHRV